MIFLLVTVAAVGLLLLPAAASTIGFRLPPREWVWLSVLAIGGGAAMLELALLLRATPGVLAAIGFGAAASACTRTLRPLLAGGPVVTWTAAVAATAFAVAGASALLAGRRLRRRLQSDLWLGERRHLAGHDVVVLPVGRPMALSFEAVSPTIVVSQGLVDRLDDAEVRAVVRHEAAHLAHRDQRLLGVAAAVAPLLGRLPGVRRSLATLHLAVERSADEQATRGSPAARAALRRSLLELLELVEPMPGVASFTESHTVAARVEALAAPPPQLPGISHVALYVPGALAAAGGVPVLYRWGAELRVVLAMAGRCSL